jgi:hypothetical protein
LFVVMAAYASFAALVWVLPIVVGIKAAKEKNYSPLWMWFAIFGPILAWVVCIVMLCMRPRTQCPHCGGFVTVNFRICPYCHAGLDAQLASADRPS